MSIAKSVVRLGAGASLALTLLSGARIGHAEPPDVPIIAGMRVVFAVSDSTAPAGKDTGIVQGDYEMVVEITSVTADAVAEKAFIDGFDADRVRRRGSIPRMVATADVANSHEQVFGFHSEDPPAVGGTTSLGPSHAVIRDLLRTGTAAYSFRNFVSRGTVSGMLRRSAASPVKFPVLIDGKRVELDGIHATGQMTLNGASRPFETVILDHPRYPLSLRIAYGPRDGAFPFTPAFVREIIRIDLPTTQETVAGALARECRVEVPGIYFDFNQATIKPESERTLKDIAAVLGKLAQRRFTIEGHTDNIGSDPFNDDLSSRRADAVKEALARDFGVDAARLSTVGYGERRPLETNATLAGRARNRRVELTCTADR